MSDDLPVTRYFVGGVVIDALTPDQLIGVLASAADRRTTCTAGYLNAHNFLLAERDPALARTLAGFDVVFCDGVGLRRGLGLLGIDLPARMTPPDFVDRLVGALGRSGGRLFLLGDEPGVAERAAERYEAVAPGVVAGCHHGFFAAEEEAEVVRAIAASDARVILVGMGTPLQEQTIARLADTLPERTWLAVGGLFRWHAGIERRGPRWLTDHGFEWLCRLAVQPRRVGRRYLIGLPRFGLRLLRLRVTGPRPRREVRSLAVS